MRNTSVPSSRPNFTLQTYEERESFRIKRQQKEELHAAMMSQEKALLAVKERDLRLERDKQDMTEAERELTRLVRRQQQSSIPPPPPLPTEHDGASNHLPTLNCSPLESSLPPLPPFPPDCPTPDYDRESLASEASVKHKSARLDNKVSTKNGNADFVEMQSLESFKLTNPSVTKPKPPPVYFQPRMNGSTTTSTTSNKSSEANKPSITIREYPQNSERKNPERFQFLAQGPANSSTNLRNDEPIASRLQDELCQTLSRANLKRDINVGDKITAIRPAGKNTVTISISAQPQHQNQTQDSSKQAPFYLHENGPSKASEIESSKEISRKISTTLINQTFPTTNGIKIDDLSNKNSVSFNFSQAKGKTDSKTVTVIPPNGILKNGVGGNVAQVQIHPLQGNKSPSKSIKFAGICAANSQAPKK